MTLDLSQYCTYENRILDTPREAWDIPQSESDKIEKYLISLGLSRSPTGKILATPKQTNQTYWIESYTANPDKFFIELDYASQKSK